MNDDEDDDSEAEVKVAHDGTANFSSDEELLENELSGNTENMFDSLKEDKTPEEKPKQKRKLGPKMETNPAKRPKKKSSYSGSDDDFASSKVRLI